MLESTNAYLLPPDIALYNQPEIIPATPPPAYRWQSITLLSHDISPPNYRLQDATGSVHGTSHASDNSSMASSFCDVTGVNDGGFVRNCAFDIHKIEFLHKLARFDGDDIVLPSQVTAVLDDCVAGSSSARDGGQTIDDEAGFVLVSSTTPALMSNSAREQQLPANVSDEE
jgi:hypothetical protein